MSLRFVVAASTVGTLIEWYDFFAYASLSPIIASLFFPKGNPAAAIIGTWLVFATGFVVRPIGALVFGHLGDRIGRKSTFLATLILMGLSTTGIGLLPTYAQAGLAATALLAALRMVQGIALGGEYGGAVTYALEYAPSGRRAFYVGFISATPPLGLGLSSLTVVLSSMLLTAQEFAAWGWRVPFLLALALTALGAYLRLKLAETPLFGALKEKGAVSKIPIVEAFAKYWKWILVGIAVAAGHAVLAYTSTAYIFTFLTQVARWTSVEANIIVGTAAVLQLPLYIFAAWLGDRLGRRLIYVIGLVIGIATYYPIYLFLSSLRDLAAAVLAVFVLIGATAFTFSILGTALAELFPTRVRYTGMSIAFNIGIGFFGGFTPSIVGAIGLALHNPLAGVALYTYVVAIVALAVAILALPETKNVDISA
ncbi:major facilitator superfamily MFS_1 [Thermoproteus uzoniensis 768-20]|uniref:Major facilitator superfamily MFS_1 n=1 Tax=Thermoproteus uzoniensis (strain 768-20) TaxID=999630 RepID=F2L5S7_THEU7|nr:MFS transporter [Thermoproteus uzoniensis]AEA13623.1 major facilitator superfamily MFS_1 [Thermoproteus uzoniensis 768-20]